MQNISSTACYGCPTAYGVSKLAVRGLTIAMARDFAADGIRVNGIAPGLIHTDTIKEELPEWVIDTVMKARILDRKGKVADIVEAMRSKSSFISGETMLVSGCFTLSI